MGQKAKKIQKRTVGFIIHPLNFEEFSCKFSAFYNPISIALKPLFRSISPYWIKRAFAKFPPHVFFKMTGIKINDEKELSIIGVMCPLFPDQMVVSRNLAIKKISESILVARKQGAQIITLAGFTSIVSNGGKDVVEDAGIPITSGNTLTTFLCIEGIREATKRLGKDLKQCNMAIIGATGDIGSACANFFSDKVKSLVLCSRTIDVDTTIVKLTSGHLAELKIDRAANNAVKNADVVLLATSAFGELIDSANVKAGAIVCDASMPPNIAKNIALKRSDIFAFDGGRAAVDFYSKINTKKWHSLFPSNAIYGCVAEAFALALEGRLENYSFGKGEISLERIQEIGLIARKNGISLSNFHCNENEQEFTKIQNIEISNLGTRI